jgi:hypothetical protein
MAVSAATAFVVVVFAATVALTVAIAVVVVMTTASATPTQVCHQMFYLLSCGLTVLQYSTFESKVFACQRVIQVYLNLIFADFDNTSVKTLSLFVLQGNDSVLIDMLMVKVSVDTEYLAAQVEHEVVSIFTIGLVLGDGKVETGTFLQVYNLLFKSIQGYSKSRNKLEWTLLCCLFHHLKALLTVNKQLIGHFHVLILFLHKFVDIFPFRLAKLQINR